MSSESHESSDASGAGSAGGGGSFSLLRVLLIVAPIAIVAYLAVQQFSGKIEAGALDAQNQTTFLRMLGRHDELESLGADYQDADGDLIADPPADEAALLLPDEIVFSYVAGADPSDAQALWQPVTDAIAQQTGQPVRFQRFVDTGEQLRALRDGQLHVTAFGTGAVPQAVNEAGFVPLASFADAEGVYAYTMRIVVPAASPIQSPADLRGRRMTFTRPRSNSGYKAALVMLLKDHQLQPERDYQWGFSYGHETSILGIASGEFEAASVASDLLEGMLASGAVDAAALRTIYESAPFPPAAVGYTHRLAPALAEGVRAALLGLDLAGTEIETRLGGPGIRKFASIDYKTDWEPVRAINKTLREARAAAE